jgi:hypothetical protein
VTTTNQGERKMKISKSKKELARIISENGGWRELAESAAQCIGGEISFWHDTATKQRGEDWCGSYLGASDDIKFAGVKLPNWHQTILSREEYFHLCQAPDADGWIEWNGGECPVGDDSIVDVMFCNGRVGIGLSPLPAGGAEMEGWRLINGRSDIIAYRLHKHEKVKSEFCESVMRSIPEPTAKPTIEQLATDYRNAKDYADRKRQEADDANADADARLKALEIAGEAIGLTVSPITAKQEPELVITDWRDLQVGDEVECVESNIKRDKYNGAVGRLRTIDESDTSTPYLVDFGGNEKIWCHEVKFISRP